MSEAKRITLSSSLFVYIMVELYKLTSGKLEECVNVRIRQLVFTTRSA